MSCILPCLLSTNQLTQIPMCLYIENHSLKLIFTWKVHFAKQDLTVQPNIIHTSSRESIQLIHSAIHALDTIIDSTHYIISRSCYYFYYHHNYLVWMYNSFMVWIASRHYWSQVTQSHHILCVYYFTSLLAVHLHTHLLPLLVSMCYHTVCAVSTVTVE